MFAGVGVGSSLENLTSLLNQTILTVAGHNLPDPPSASAHSAAECAERCKSSGTQSQRCIVQFIFELVVCF